MQRVLLACSILLLMTSVSASADIGDRVTVDGRVTGPDGDGSAAPGDTDRDHTILNLAERVSRSVPRDRIHAALCIEATGVDQKTLKEETDRRLAAAADRVKQHAGVTIEVGPYVIAASRGPMPASRGFSSGSGSSTPPPPEWTATQHLEIISADRGVVLDLAAQLESDGLILTGLRLGLSQDAIAAAERTLEPQAIAALRQQAAIEADAMGMRIDHFRSITVNATTTENPYVLRQQLTLNIPLTPGNARFNQATPVNPFLSSSDFSDADVWATARATVVLTRKPE